MTPVSELPFNVRPKTRKEKNKLASRACRLKKKAQHEANKIKLFGLENEHSECLLWYFVRFKIQFPRLNSISERLLSGITHMKQLLALKCSNTQDKQEEINQRMEDVYAKATGKHKKSFFLYFLRKLGHEFWIFKNRNFSEFEDQVSENCLLWSKKNAFLFYVSKQFFKIFLNLEI